MKSFVARIRYRIKVKKAIEVFAKRLLPRVLTFQSANSFYSAAGIEQSGRFLFGKAQKHLLLNFLEHVRRSMPSRQVEYTIANCTTYVSVRLL